VKENARHFKQHFSSELLRVILHGALHLCGYDDSTPAQQEEMRQKEEHYLNLF
jgi:rRNA maturation RNase YbeY